MNKALLIPMQPQHAVNILNGKKTLELRSWIPKDYKGWVYVYVKNGVGKSKYHHLYNLTEYNNGKTLFSITHHNKHSLVPDGFLNGKVVFRFWFDEYDSLTKYYKNDALMFDYKVYDNNIKFILENTSYLKNDLCLSYQEVLDYGNGKPLYAWHIKQIEVFDKPKELGEFESRTPYKNNDGRVVAWGHSPIIRAPQKMQWVYVEK